MRFDGAVDWIKKMMSETMPDGTAATPSFSRVAAGVTAGFSLGWITTQVVTATIHNLKHPDLGPWPIVPDPATLAALSMFVGGMYGLNRVTAFFGTKK